MERMPREEDEDKWDLPEELANFFGEYTRKHYAEKDMKNFMKCYPCPSNISCVPQLDDSAKKSLKDKNLNQTLELDDEFAAIQERIQDVMGPLGAAWGTLKLWKAGELTITEAHIQGLVDQLQKSVVLVGHSMQKASWYRRVNVLSAIGKTNGAKIADIKSLLKQDKIQSIFETNTSGELFSAKFDEVTKTEKTSRSNFADLFRKKESKKDKKETKTATNSNFKPSNSLKRPFPASPLPRGGGYRESGNSSNWFRNGGGGQPNSRSGSSNPFRGGYGKGKFSSETFCSMLPHPTWLSSLEHVHPMIKGIFPITEVSSPLAGRIQRFLVNWKLLTTDKNILNIVKGWEVPLMSLPIQTRLPQAIKMNSLEETVMDREVESMLAKGAIREAIPKPDQFLSNVFVTPKKEEGEYRPIINLKGLNRFVPYHHFKMEGLKDVKNLLRKGDWMCKMDLKDAYFSVPLNPRSRKLVRFQWKGTLYEFLSLAFGLGPAPRVFTKLMKVPISFLRKLGVCLVIYLDDLLIIASSKEKLKMARDTTMYLFHHLGLTINLKKSFLEPTQIIEFLGVMVDSIKLTFSLPEKKIQKLISKCHKRRSTCQK